MKIKIPHNLSKGEILEKMQKVFAELKQEYSEEVTILEERWQGDKASFVAMAKGIKLKGDLSVSDAEVEFDIHLPLMLKVFEPQLKAEFEKEFKKRVLQ